MFEHLLSWARTDCKRIVKRDKWMLTDSGRMASLMRYPEDPGRLHDDQVGKIAEFLVGCELLALADASGGGFLVSHYRDNEGQKMDFLIDDEDTGGVIGIEVKASNTVGARDFRWFAENLTENRPFVGAVLYCGTDVLHFGGSGWRSLFRQCGYLLVIEIDDFGIVPWPCPSSRKLTAGVDPHA